MDARGGVAESLRAWLALLGAAGAAESVPALPSAWLPLLAPPRAC